MKRSSKLALTLVLAAGAIAPAMAQDNFPNVPANHWAYDALARMKADGILVGYPDGMYHGTRPASRYELAVAINAVYTHLKGTMDGMQSQLDLLKNINPQDIQNLKDQVAHLQDEINAMKGWGDDIAALKKAAEEFSKELHDIGVDVDAMKKDLGDLQSRVTALEKKKPAVDISGDVNFFMVSTNADRNNHYGLDQDGKFEGITKDVSGAGVAHLGLFHDLTFLHEGAFTVAGTNEHGPKWSGTFVAGNMKDAQGFSTQSTFAPSIAPGTNYAWGQGDEAFYIQDLSVKTDVKVIGLALDAEAGRVAYKLSPYMLQRPNFQSYFMNERWNDGKYRFDGAILGFNFGPAKVHVWGGNTSNLVDNNGVELNPLSIANNRTANGQGEDGNGFGGTKGTGGALSSGSTQLAMMDKAAGVDVNFALGHNGHVNLGYLVLEQEGTLPAPGTEPNDLLGTNDGGKQGANRDNILGGDANFGFGRFKLSGGYHRSYLTANTDAVSSHDNQAWDVMAKYTANKFNIWGGYRRIEENYYAPGDWGRLGILQNPANIKGWQAGGYIDVSKVIRLTAEGEWDEAVDNGDSAHVASGFASPFGRDFTGADGNQHTSHIRQYMARVDFRVNNNLSLYGSINDSRFSNLVGGGGNPATTFDWTTIGLGYGLSANAKFNLSYQFSNVGNFAVGTVPDDRFVGGILTSQLTIKF